MRRIIVVAVLTALAIAPAASAKDGVVAHLTAPLATSPSGGVAVEFSLVAEDGSRFSASDIYVRARTTEGRVLEIWPEERGTGNFAGVLPTRRSELADLEVGLVGYSSPGGRSDMMFPIADDPFPGPPPARGSTSAGGDRGANGVDGAKIAVLLILVAVALGAAGAGVLRIRRVAGAR